MIHTLAKTRLRRLQLRSRSQDGQVYQRVTTKSGKRHRRLLNIYMHARTIGPVPNWAKIKLLPDQYHRRSRRHLIALRGFLCMRTAAAGAGD